MTNISKKVKLSIFFILGLAQLLWAHPSYAVEAPSFSQCPNPGGQILASYDTGIHGIPGRSETFSGSDRVYQITDTTVVQCFCSAHDGSGIQTNWWKVDTLNQNEISFFEKLGWVYIPNGSLWGLAPTGYLAQNITMNCSGGIGGNSDQRSSTSTGAGGVSVTDNGVGGGFTDQGNILGITSFAATGTRRQILLMALAACAFCLTILLYKNS